MKRSSAFLLGLPLVFAVGCASEETEPTVRSFLTDFEPGLMVAGTGSTKAVVESYVDLGGTVTQVDGLDVLATGDTVSDTCQVRVDERQTVFDINFEFTSKTRVAGKQKAWFLPDSYDSAWADSEVNVWGDLSYGQLFLRKPNLDIWIDTQAGVDGPRALDMYLTPYELELALIEDERNFSIAMTETVTTDTQTVVSNMQFYDDDYSTHARFNAEGFVWESWDILGNNDVYDDEPLEVWNNMLVPEKVKVGDTWINEDGNIVGAVAIEKIKVGDTTVDALHIVTRGTREFDTTKRGVLDSCIDFHTAQTVDDPETKRLDAVETGKCEDESAGWVNTRHEWYYKGLRVKIVEEGLNVEVEEFGYAAANDGDLPTGMSNGAAVGECALWADGDAATGTPEQLGRLQKYAVYTVEKGRFEWQATEFRTNDTLAQEYKDGLVAAE